ncbi:MAG TPA: type II CAAX endopeptidase family protein [Gemmatimonadaceae bacterium]|nr:MAG: hypothetical protein ABS52_09265 [Gemmatimonadetes bacterium SCN 70-22]HMN09422.1 type II CAAX endopeptidase family protein [Gemmatimonadaceae bacterium]
MSVSGGEELLAPSPGGREWRGGSVAPAWKFAIFLLACSVGYLGARAVLPPVAAWVEGATGVRLPTYVLTWSIGMLVGHWWTFRVVEPDGWRLVALDRAACTPRALLVGGALGAAAVGVPSLALLGIGWLRVEAMPPGDVGREALLTLALLVPAALWEELATRGYAFALLRERLGAQAAIVLTSVAFGLMHLENAGATLQSIAVVTLAGIFLGSILVAMRSLYAAWAAHVAWNFVMAGVMHTSVSGTGLGAPNYRTVDAGPDWATGGAWGPEAGLFAAAGMLLAIVFLLRRGARPRS